MANSSRKPSSRVFIALLFLLVMARGVLLLCVLPPLEGWDEYQHVAYIQHLIEHGGPPIMLQSTVSRRLLARLAGFPQPRFMVEQTRETGALDYSHFSPSSKPIYLEDHHDIPLYEAQQGSLYYYLVKPLFSLSGGIEDLKNSISFLRLLNLFLTAISLLGCFLLIDKMVEKKTHGLLLMLLISCQPLYLLNGCRVANDPLAITLGAFVIIWGLQSGLHGRMSLFILTGCLLGLGIWTKLFDMPLLPFICFCLAVSIYAKSITLKRAVLGSALLFGAMLTAYAPDFIFNLHHYNLFFLSQEALNNHQHGKTILELLPVSLNLPLPERILSLWLWDSTWTGGWSWRLLVSPPIFHSGPAVLMCFALLGWIYSLAFRPSSPGLLFTEKYFSMRCFVLVCCLSIGLGWHMLQTYSSYGKIGTNSWYAFVAFPFLLMLAYEGATRWSVRAGIIFGWTMVLLYLSAEFYGTFVQMIPYYSGGRAGAEGLRRIALYHPPWLGVTTFYVSLLFSLLLFCSVTAVWVRNRRDLPG